MERLTPCAKGSIMLRTRVIMVAVIAALSVAPTARETGDPAAVPTAGESVPPIHADPAQVMKDFTAAAAAAILDDTAGMVEALERVAADCRSIHDPADKRYPSVLRGNSQAFHTVIATTKSQAAEAINAGDVDPRIKELLVDRAFQQYQWAERGCRICHGQAAQEGLYPPGTD